jgi:ATP-dependent RNA helicase SUPV3L1/SUV3
MDVDHVAVAGLRKFDGRRTRWLHAAEIGQIAGRAGRHLRDGTFGVTGEAEELDEDLVEQVVEHRFDPVEAAEWRSGRLDFDTLPDLLRSLTVTPDRHGLRLTAQALDETLLRRFAADEDVKKIARSRGALMRLWEACQLPDFQKTTLDEHARLSKEIFTALTSHGPHGRGGRLTEDWVAPRFNDLDRDDGQIDQLSARLSGVRTLSYIANRPDWMAGAQEWRDRTKALEERLSDVLHERLTARFVDRRTAALMRALNVRSDVLAGVADDGEVTVEGEVVGHLDGVCFTVDAGGSALADRALRQAATRAVGPEVARRLGRLAADEDATFSVMPDGGVLWNGALTGRIINEDPFSPRVRLLGELGPVPARERAERRMEAWLAAEAGRALKPLKRLRHAIESGALTGLPRGLAFRLVEAGGLIPRREVERDLAALSQHERRTLKTFAIRVGAHSVWLPGVMKPRGAALAQAFLPREATNGLAGDGLLNLPEPPPSARALSAFGRRAVDRWTAPVEALEALAEAQRAAGKAPLSDEALNALGWTGDQARAIHAALRTPRADRAPRPGKPTPPTKDSPFAALAQLTQPPPPAAKPKTARRPHRRPRRATDGKAAE